MLCECLLLSAPRRLDRKILSVVWCAGRYSDFKLARALIARVCRLDWREAFILWGLTDRRSRRVRRFRCITIGRWPASRVGGGGASILMPSPSIRGAVAVRPAATLPLTTNVTSARDIALIGTLHEMCLDEERSLGTQVPDVLGAYVNLLHFHWGCGNVARRRLLLPISITTGRVGMRALAILPVLPLVLTTPALAQNAQWIQQQPTSPNSGGDSWTARRQKRTRREPSTATTGSGAESGGAQLGCGQGSRIAGQQERSSSQVTLQLSPDLEVGGACAQQGGALARHRSGSERSRHDYSSVSSARRAKA